MSSDYPPSDLPPESSVSAHHMNNTVRSLRQVRDRLETLWELLDEFTEIDQTFPDGRRYGLLAKPMGEASGSGQKITHAEFGDFFMSGTAGGGSGSDSGACVGLTLTQYRLPRGVAVETVNSTVSKELKLCSNNGTSAPPP